MINKLKALGIQVNTDLDMSKFTTFKAGGKAKYAVTANNEDELKKVLSILDSEKVKHILVGNGSNLIFKDEGYDGVVIFMSSEDEFGKIEINGSTCVCGAKVLMSTLAKNLATQELSGFEALSGIPGTIGGAVFMNAGAYDSEIKDILVSIHAVSPDGSVSKDFDLSELDLSYRHSLLMDNGYIVTHATFKLKPGKEEEILKAMANFQEKRNSKQPLKYPSSGSFFKRPVGYFAGKLIEDAGLKGLTVGGAQVSTLHAGFIINAGNATATDVIKLMRLVQNIVYDKYQVKLEPEVRII